MTGARPWPNNARRDRDEAAERMNAVIRNGRALRKVVSRGNFTREELLYLASLIIDDAHTAVRHLERHGAQTIPTPRENGE